MTKYPEIITEYMGIERGAVQQVMYRADMGRGHAETRCRVWNLDGRPYVRAYGERFYLSEEEAQAARQACEVPYMRVLVGTYGK